MPNLSVKASRLTLSGSIETYLDKKMVPLQKFLRDENKVRVQFGLEPEHHTGPRFKAEMEIGPNSEYFAEAYGNDLHEAVDLLIPKIKEQLVKKRDKAATKKLRQERRKRM